MLIFTPFPGALIPWRFPIFTPTLNTSHYFFYRLFEKEKEENKFNQYLTIRENYYQTYE
jgi:hypothetical protein